MPHGANYSKSRLQVNGARAPIRAVSHPALVFTRVCGGMPAFEVVGIFAGPVVPTACRTRLEERVAGALAGGCRHLDLCPAILVHSRV